MWWLNHNICEHFSKNLHSLHNHVYLQNEIICEITHATGNIYKDLWGQQSIKEALN